MKNAGGPLTPAEKEWLQDHVSHGTCADSYGKLSYARLAEVIAYYENMVCAKPGVVSCARQWEANHQMRALEDAGLAQEFPYGIDAIQHVAEALIEARSTIADFATTKGETR